MDGFNSMLGTAKERIGKNWSRVMDVENKLMATREHGWGEGRHKLGDWDWHIYTIIYEIDN